MYIFFNCIIVSAYHENDFGEVLYLCSQMLHKISIEHEFTSFSCGWCIKKNKQFSGQFPTSLSPFWQQV